MSLGVEARRGLSPVLSKFGTTPALPNACVPLVADSPVEVPPCAVAAENLPRRHRA